MKVKDINERYRITQPRKTRKRTKYISAGKAAQFMGVSVSYLHKLCREKKISHARIGFAPPDAMGRDMRPVVIAEYEIDNLMEIIQVEVD